MHLSILSLSPVPSFLPSVEDVLYHEGKVDLCVCVCGGWGGCWGCGSFRWGRAGRMGFPCVWVCVCFYPCLELICHCSVCATTPSLICWFPVFSILCVLFCSEARHTPWIGSVVYVFILISIFFNAFGNSQSSNSSLVSPTFRFWLTHALDAIDSVFLTNLVWLSGWHVALSTISNQPWRCSEPAGCEGLRFLTKAYVSLWRVCVYFNTSPLERVWRCSASGNNHPRWLETIPTNIRACLSPPFYLFSVRFDSFEGRLTMSPRMVTNILWPN